MDKILSFDDFCRDKGVYVGRGDVLLFELGERDEMRQKYNDYLYNQKIPYANNIRQELRQAKIRNGRYNGGKV